MISSYKEGLKISLGDSEDKEFEVTRIPLDGILDLHMFAPKDVASVVDEYLNACIEKGIFEVKIIHGKGKGVIRQTVHTLLKRHPLVVDFRLDSGPSGWGASIAHLKNDPAS